jgi:predicted dehydrogenase
MGAVHARVVHEHPRTRVALVVDHDIDTAFRVASRYGAVSASDTDFSGVDAVVIATTPSGHASWTRRAIESGIAALVEKPLADDPSLVRELLAASAARGVPVACGFSERHHPAVVAATRLVPSPRRFRAERRSMPDARVTLGAVADLVIHDVDLACRMAEGDLVSVDARVTGADDGSPERQAEVELGFACGFVATLRASQLGPVKQRRLSMSVNGRTAEADTIANALTLRENGTTRSIDLGAHVEPLRAQLDHFVGLVEGDIDPAVERESLRAPHDIIARIAADARRVPSP